jgi:hypothetical protein
MRGIVILTWNSNFYLYLLRNEPSSSAVSGIDLGLKTRIFGVPIPAGGEIFFSPLSSPAVGPPNYQFGIWFYTSSSSSRSMQLTTHFQLAFHVKKDRSSVCTFWRDIYWNTEHISLCFIETGTILSITRKWPIYLAGLSIVWILLMHYTC